MITGINNTTAFASPVAVNASTTYGVDTSASNNYGLGGSYRSTATLKSQADARANRPSLWWLVGLVALLAVV